MTSDEIFERAAGPDRYPPWLYIGGVGLKGGGDRLMACFRPCTTKPKETNRAQDLPGNHTNNDL